MDCPAGSCKVDPRVENDATKTPYGADRAAMLALRYFVRSLGMPQSALHFDLLFKFQFRE